MTSKKGITLIEVLVVIGIVTLLLTFLFISLQPSLKQAELAVCAANLRGVTTSFLTYAFDHSRTFPRMTETRMAPELIALSTLDASRPSYDLRTLVEPYMALPSFHCKLSPDISFAYADTGRPAPGATVVVFSNYSIWPGWRSPLDEMNQETVMYRLGDRWTWQGTRFSVLASDGDSAGDDGNGHASASHPDEDGVMVDEANQNVSGGTWSDWSSTPPLKRGTLDTNYAMDDGAVLRYIDVALKDPRMKRVDVYQVPQP